MHPLEWSLCETVFLSIFMCVCVCAYVTSPDSRGIPSRYYATVLCKTLFCTKGPFHARLFRSLYIKNATGWVVGYIVTNSLGAFCPWFDSWEPGTVVTCESHVSGFSHIIVLIPTLWTGSICVKSLQAIVASLLIAACPSGEIYFCASLLTLQLKL